MFKTNGSTHYEGIANEHAVIELLNNRNYFDCPVTHLGGTKNKADAMAGSTPISIKRKKGLRNGSFDYVNTSKTDALVNRTLFKEFTSECNAWRSRTIDNSVNVDSEVLKRREKFGSLCQKALESITPKQITEFLQEHVHAKQDGFKLVVADSETNCLYIIDHERTPLAQLLAKGYHAEVVMGKGQSSAKILFNGDRCHVDIGLRVRVTSNNGIRAFMGLSKANKNSQVVIKIQQDKVQQFVKDSSPTIVFAG